MAQTTDQQGQPLQVGVVVDVTCIITAITPGSLVGVSLLTLTPKYTKPDNSAATSITTVYATQTMISK